jgi:8-oxo-dGTP pyrophosphatase MutT (NUDIX family)
MEKQKKTPKPPRPASTVVLAREHDSRLEVYLLKRSAKSDFFPGNYVFPGGTVDEEDRATEHWKGHLDIGLEEILRQFGGGLTVDEAIAYGVAAIRETFEEAGVLLAQRDEQGPEDLERLCHQREAEKLTKNWLREWVVSEGWTLLLSQLGRWAHWITPEAMSRRFDTRFFVAFMPEGQACQPDARETTEGIWISPEEGLLGNLRGEIPLSPPTLVTLQELLSYASLDDLKTEVKARAWDEARLPRLVRVPDGALILEPWDPMISEEISVDTKVLESAVLPLGEPFSRLWYHGGLWRPVGN